MRSWQLSAQEQGAGLAKPPWQQGPGCVLHPAVLIPEQKDKPRQQSRAEQPPAQVKGSEPAAWTQHKEPALGRHRDVVRAQNRAGSSPRLLIRRLLVPSCSTLGLPDFRR